VTSQLPLVTLVRRDFAGDVRRQSLPAPAAVAVLLTDPANGITYYSGHIEWGRVPDNWPMGYDIPITEDPRETVQR
jgi:hypothetical protein